MSAAEITAGLSDDFLLCLILKTFQANCGDRDILSNLHYLT